MKQKQDIYSRQNDKTAITLLKASYRCLRNERIAKYIMIVLSFGICLAAIFNKYLPQMASGVSGIETIQETAATYINLISGVILVVGIVVGFYTTRMHAEGIALQDRYDAHVFDNPPNLSILRPISQTVINVYAQKTRKKEEAFRDFIYKPSDDPDPDVAQFNYINNEAHSDYRLYLSIQPFFITLWIGFCVIIIALAVSFNDTFVTTLINIMIPSLSAITTIGNSWYNCRLQMRQLQNLLTVIDQIQRLPDGKRLEYISDKRNMRALADGLFNYRVSPFVIPNFLVRRHLKMTAMQSVSLTVSDKRSPKTEMPTLILPDLGDTVPEINNIINGEIRDIRTVSFSPTHTVTKIKAKSNRYTKRATEPQRAAPPVPAKAAQKTPRADDRAKPAAVKNAAPVKSAAKSTRPAAKQPQKNSAPAKKQNGADRQNEAHK